MSQSVIGSLRVNLGLDSAQFSKGARGLNAPLKRMQRQFQAVAGVATIMGGAIAAAALAGARQIDEAAKSARRLDASIGGFRALEIAAGEAGVSLSGLTNDIQTINRELASIGVSGNGKRALDALGLSISDLGGKDADEKLAIIADQVKALGLSAGETTAILRDLGVRNREMALLVLDGGEAIRSARSDVQDYGLAISAIDASRIEVANDRLGRLGLITQYAGQQLAIALVPAMGALAQAMTDSLREGGALRAVIDGLTGNIDVLINTMGVAVVGFGVRYVTALAIARGATKLLSGSLIVLRGALMATGIGALIVGAGVALTYFTRLVTAVGGFGAAMGLLKDVASEVFSRIGYALNAFRNRFAASWLDIKASAYDAFQGIQDRAYSMADTLVGVAVGAKDAFIAAFQALPNALGGLMYASANAVIGGVEAMINGVIGMVNGFTGMINNTLNGLPEWAKPDGGFNMGQMPDVSFGRVEFAGSEGMAAAAGEAFAAAANQTYVNAAPQTAGAMADALRTAADSRENTADIWGGLANAPLASVNALGQAVANANEKIAAGVDPINDVATGLDDVADAAAGGGAGGGAAGALAETATQAETAADVFANRLKDAIGTAADAFGDWVARGFKDFKGMVNSIKDAFLGMLADMIKAAAANPIKVALGVGGTGAAGGLGGGLQGLIGNAIGGFGGSGGIMGALTGGGGLAAGFSGLAGGSGILGGLGNTLAGTFGTGGGIGGLVSSIGGGAGIMSSIGAALPIIGIAAAVFSFFKKKTTILDEGIRATIDMESAMFESFQKIQTTRFWGLSKKTSFKYKDLSDDESAPFNDAVFGVQESVIGATDALGISADIFEGFTHQFSVSLKGLDDAAKEAAVLEALEGLGDAMAEQVTGLDEFTLAGEGAFEALTRLSTSLVTVNDVFRDLGFNLYNVSLAGADGAAAFADLFGSLDNFTSATAAYYDQFYTDTEKLTNATARLSESLGDLGINVLPTTNAAFRDLVETAMLAGDSDLAASLIQLAPAFDTVTDATAALRASLNDLSEDAFSNAFDYRRAMARTDNGIAYAAQSGLSASDNSNAVTRDEFTQMREVLERIASEVSRGADAGEDQLYIAGAAV